MFPLEIAMVTVAQLFHGLANELILFLFVVLHSLFEHKKCVPLKEKAIENIQNKTLR
jgi:hypothetical protein